MSPPLARPSARTAAVESAAAESAAAESANAQAGVSLIELMISMILVSMLSSGLLYMVSGQQRTYGEQIDSTTQQYNLSGAMTYVKRQIRQAGYGFGGCPASRVKKWTIGSSGGTEDSPVVGLAIYNDCNLLNTAPGSCPDGSGADSLTVTAVSDLATASAPALRLASSMADQNDDLEVNTIGNFQANDLVILRDQNSTRDCLLLKVTSTAAGAPAQLIRAPDGVYNPPTAAASIFPSGGFQLNSLAVRLGPSSLPRHFAVDTTVSPPRLVTWTTLAANPSSDTADMEVLSDGIEDMQLSAACDLDGDGLAEEGIDGNLRKTDEWANNVAGDTVPACGARPFRAVRVTLTARSAGARVGNKRGYRPATEDRAAGTTSDDLSATGQVGTYARQTLTTTVTPINLE